jgi:hypothetical protein
MEIKEIKIKIRQVENNQICICDDDGKDVLYMPYGKHSLAYHYLYAKLSDGETTHEKSGLHLQNVSGSLTTENALNFLHWMHNWGHLSIEVKEKDFAEFIRQYNSCSEHSHNLGNDR